MVRIKLLVTLIFALTTFPACFDSKPKIFTIVDNKSYEASLFRQHCAVCHGAEGNGKTLVDDTVVPSLKVGEFKAKTEAEIYKQIAEGGNGMLPFRSQLTERELRLMVVLVHRDFRSGQ